MQISTVYKLIVLSLGLRSIYLLKPESKFITLSSITKLAILSMVFLMAGSLEEEKVCEGSEKETETPNSPQTETEKKRQTSKQLFLTNIIYGQFVGITKMFTMPQNILGISIICIASFFLAKILSRYHVV